MPADDGGPPVGHPPGRRRDSVGFAICGAWLVADLPGGTFPKCATCLALLDERPP